MQKTNNTQKTKLPDSLVDFFGELSKRFQDRDLAHQLAKELETRTLEPLDLAVLLQAKESTIQKLYQSNPNQLTQQTIELACQYGAKPGVIPFLARASPSLMVPQEGAKESPLSIAMRGGPNKGPSEEDIKALVEAYPEAVTKEFYFSDECPEWCSPLQKCIPLGYSMDLCKFMCEKYPISNQMVRMTKGDTVCLCREWMPLILPKIRGRLNLSAMFWDSNDFLGLLQLVFEHARMQSLELWLPAYRCGEDLVVDSSIALSQLASMAPSVPSLSLHFCTKESFQAYSGLLNNLSQWPRLQSLTVDLRFCHLNHIQEGVDSLCRLLEAGKLKYLTLSSKYSPMDSQKEKVKKLASSPFAPLFVSLVRNKTLEELNLQMAEDEPKEELQELLLDALRNNTTLKQVRGFAVGDQNLFYLTLNTFGRAVFRNPESSPTALARILHMVHKVFDGLNGKRNLGRKQNGHVNASSIQHALLLESVGIWAG